MMHNLGFFLLNSFKQPLQRLIFLFLIISSYCCSCGWGCGGLGPKNFPKGTGFCLSTFTKFDNFESCDLLVSKADGFFFKILDSMPSFFRLRSFWLMKHYDSVSQSFLARGLLFSICISEELVACMISNYCSKGVWCVKRWCICLIWNIFSITKSFKPLFVPLLDGLPKLANDVNLTGFAFLWACSIIIPKLPVFCATATIWEHKEYKL